MLYQLSYARSEHALEDARPGLTYEAQHSRRGGCSEKGWPGTVNSPPAGSGPIGISLVGRLLRAILCAACACAHAGSISSTSRRSRTTCFLLASGSSGRRRLRIPARRTRASAHFPRRGHVRTATPAHGRGVRRPSKGRTGRLSRLTEGSWSQHRAPTVLPPSRMANRRFSSMAIGVRQLDGHLDVVAGHAHFGLAVVLREEVQHRAGHVGRPEVELGPVSLEERSVPSPSSFERT